MSFMEPEVYRGWYYVVETNDEGTEFVPADVVGLDRPNITVNGRICKPAYPYARADVEDVRDYVSGRDILSVSEPKEGWLGRMTASGYLDCTDWIVGETEEEVLEQLRDYGLEDEEDLEDAE